MGASAFENWAFLVVSVVAAIAVAVGVFHAVRKYTGGGGGGGAAAPGDLSAYDEDAARKIGYGTLRTYSLRVAQPAIAALKKAGITPPLFEDSAYVSCATGTSDTTPGTTTGTVVPAEHRNATWMPLMPSRDALQLHYDVAGGAVNYVILTGAVLRVWALPPMQETRGAVLFAVSLPEDVSFTDVGIDGNGDAADARAAAACDRLQILPVLQPFREWDASLDDAVATAQSVRANVRSVIAHESAPLLQVWAF
ncbi:hypothetical protein FOA52_001586 [Chlamydomonas sp. UWO 241]|nr:hypothetical protein FOA52_001586 [Chlamydomonas sp. UWO 241]